jgi:hypothetical protein
LHMFLVADLVKLNRPFPVFLKKNKPNLMVCSEGKQSYKNCIFFTLFFHQTNDGHVNHTNWVVVHSNVVITFFF